MKTLFSNRFHLGSPLLIMVAYSLADTNVKRCRYYPLMILDSTIYIYTHTRGGGGGVCTHTHICVCVHTHRAAYISLRTHQKENLPRRGSPRLGWHKHLV